MIMKYKPFYSSLAKQMNQFVNYKRIQGYDYTHQADALGYFDRFLNKRHYANTYLNKDIVLVFCSYTYPQASFT